MRPRTATIQVSKPYPDMWEVQIGDPKAPVPIGSFTDESLGIALMEALQAWREVEGLSD